MIPKYSRDVGPNGSQSEDDQTDYRSSLKRPRGPDSQESPIRDSSPIESKVPQQTLMEMLVADLDPSDIELFQLSDDSFGPIDEWDGVTVTNGAVTEIRWEKTFQKSGKLNFKWLPPSLKTFYLSDCDIHGKLCLDSFPDGIEEVVITNTKLSGGINFQNLPENLKVLDLSRNQFTGIADTQNLPRTLEKLILSHNHFQGPLYLQSAPDSLKLIELSKNWFEDVHLSSEKGRLILLDGNPIDEDKLVKNARLCWKEIEVIDHNGREHRRLYDYDLSRPRESGFYTIAHLTPYEPGIQWHG